MAPLDLPHDWPTAQQISTHLGELDVHVVGEGPPIVFLHLVLADATHWDRMPPLLADRFQCIMPTLPMGAHARPANAEADLSPDGLARAVAEVMDALDVADATIVGNDTGGAIAQVLAAHHADRVGRVVLTNCDMYDQFPPTTFSYFKLLPHVPGGFALTARVLRIRALWPLPIVFGRLTNEVDPEKIDRWADALLASRDVQRDAGKVIAAARPEVTNAAAAALQHTDLPFLVVWGADDRAFKPALAERFCREVPTAELVYVEDCKTFVCWDQPERLAELISDFAETAAG